MQESFNYIYNITALSNLALENVTWFTQKCEQLILSKNNWNLLLNPVSLLLLSL